MNERYVVLGLAHARAAWFGEVTRWATAGSAPIDFVKCVSTEEVHARLAAGRAVSALVVDAERAANDRDLIGHAGRNGCTVLVVDDGRIERDWMALGVTAVLSAGFGRDELVAALATHATAVGRVEQREIAAVDQHPAAWRGRLVAVTGSGGTGTSTLAMALTQGLAADPRNRGLVLLADFALDADMAMLHDARDVVPGLQEMVEACRGVLPGDEVGRLVFQVADRRYDLLLGLRRHRDWTAIRPRAFNAALDTLRRNYRVVVADVDRDVEGEEETGSADVAERNHIARHTMQEADLVLVVGNATAKGLHSLTRTMHELRAGDIAAERLVPVVNRVGRSPKQRSEIARALVGLGALHDTAVDAPLFVPERRHLDDAMRHAAPLPGALTQPLVRTLDALIDRSRSRSATRVAASAVVAVVPGSLGTYFEPEDAA